MVLVILHANMIPSSHTVTRGMEIEKIMKHKNKPMAERQ